MDVCKLKLAKDIVERAIAYKKVCESVNYIWPNRDFVMVCARPTKINRDEQGRLHSTAEKAIEYPDGWGLYCVHGVRFDNVALWQAVCSGSLSAHEILAIRNAEQRRVAYEIMDKTKMAALKPVVVDEAADSMSGPLGIVSFNVDGFKKPFLYLRCVCPSTGREYYLETRQKTCAAAVAASFGLKKVMFEKEW
jgi:hypothetical protein